MENKYCWATEDIYASVAKWEEDFSKAEKLGNFENFKGKLGEKQEFLACMQKLKEASRIIEKLSVYAYMKHDEDTSNSYYDALSSKINMLAVDFSSKTAFITPELTSLPNEVLEGYIADGELKDYDYFLSELLKKKGHVLSEKEEALLTMASEPLSCFKDIFKKEA